MSLKDILIGMFSGLLGVFWAEFTECLPWLAKRVLAAAARAVPASRRERDVEEWAAIMADTPGKILPFVTACGFWWGASKLRLMRVAGARATNATIRTLDILGVLVFYVIFGWLYLLIAAAVAISMGRPVHYWQVRVGKDGRVFRFYKFRSMVGNSEQILEAYLANNPEERARWDSTQRLKHDPRITRVGRFIRKLSLDELPQFHNVLKGDMSFIGPRPCMQRQVGLYGAAWDAYCSVRPGITGLWQVSGRNRLSYEERVELDAYYAKNRSLWLNAKILVRTVSAVFRDGAS
jgi:lipopolysaccharide/colanic/teichoic acid biosynthesis glycosyltransferase